MAETSTRCSPSSDGRGDAGVAVAVQNPEGNFPRLAPDGVGIGPLDIARSPQTRNVACEQLKLRRIDDLGEDRRCVEPAHGGGGMTIRGVAPAAGTAASGSRHY